MFGVLPFMAMKYEQQGKKTKRYWHLLSIGAAEDCYRLFGETEKHVRCLLESRRKKQYMENYIMQKNKANLRYERLIKMVLEGMLEGKRQWKTILALCYTCSELC